MQNTVTIDPVLSTTNAAGAVVKNDNASTHTPSLKLNAGGVQAKVVVESLTVEAAATAALNDMEQARSSWETTELAASNKRLYSILTDAYSYYLVMKRDTNKDVRQAREKALTSFIAERGYTFQPTTHDMTKVVKSVFGADRRRVSAYSIALREALRQSIAATDLIEFIEENGGVEQIRLGGTKPLSAKVRAERVKDQVINTELGLFKFDARLLAADADWTDKQVVIVATYLPTGEFQANAVIRHDTAVNAALAAHYSIGKAEERSRAQKERDAEKAAAAAEKQTARDAEAADQEREAANKAHAQSLFEGELA